MRYYTVVNLTLKKKTKVVANRGNLGRYLKDLLRIIQPTIQNFKKYPLELT